MKKILILGLLVLLNTTCRLDVYNNHTETEKIYTPKKCEDPFPYNPFKGWAVWSKSPDYDGYNQPYSMLYARLFWAQVEPDKNQFAWNTFEKEWQFHMATGNKKIILRVVLDNPGEHLPGMDRDIPDWLYQQIEGSGIYYYTEGQGDTDIGNGFSPDYKHPELIKEHERFISALGERYNNDPRIAFLQIGSLGHWGEWHTWPEGTGDFPPYSIAAQYIEHYHNAFPNKLLLIRRPVQYNSQEFSLGVYNDVIGNDSPGSTPMWLAMISDGYTSEWDGATHLPLTPDWWHRAPSGGELATHPDGVEYWLEGDNFSITLQHIMNGHTSWVGPSCPVKIPDSERYQAEIDQMLKTMGYRFIITQVQYPTTAKAGTVLPIICTIENQGIAPIYYNWPLEISIINNKGHIAYTQIMSHIDIRKWLPGEREEKIHIVLPSYLASGQYSFAFALLDPTLHTPAIEFAIDQSLRRKDGRYVLGEFAITQ